MLLSHVLLTKGEILPIQHAEKIISRFPKYNLEWLEFGIGNMINENKNTAGRDNYGSQGSGDNKSSYSNVGNTKISVTNARIRHPKNY